MTYYLKYRSQTLDQLDLEKVRDQLQKIVSSGRVPHALLFSGPRGSGKTSAARILAKVVNCEIRDKDKDKDKQSLTLRDKQSLTLRDKQSLTLRDKQSLTLRDKRSLTLRDKHSLTLRDKEFASCGIPGSSFI